MVRSVNTPSSYMSMQRRLHLDSLHWLTNWEYEAPPSHVEGEWICCDYHYNSDNEPNNCKAPKYDAANQAKEIEGVPSMGHTRDRAVEWKAVSGNLSKCYQTILLLAC
jgi:hypothetical protein